MAAGTSGRNHRCGGRPAVLACRVLALLIVAPLAHARSAEELVTRLKRAWDGISTYRTDQLMQERVRGTLGPEQRVKVAFRKPWEIQLEWETVHPGRKVYWSGTRHEGEVQVYPGGLTGRTLGVLSFAPDNPILRRDSNHPPADGGFGYLVVTVLKAAAAGTLAGAPVQTSVNGERAWSVAIPEVTYAPYARGELVVSDATGLPLKFTGWQADGGVYERYEWSATVVNVPLVDAVDFSMGYR